MKPIKNTKMKRIYGFLSIVLGLAISFASLWMVLILVAIIRGTPSPITEGLPVNILTTNNHFFENHLKGVFIGDVSGKLMFLRPTFFLMLFSVIYTLIIWVSASYIVFVMRKILRSLIEGSPFDKDNGIRLRNISILFMIVPLILHFSSSLIVSSLIKTIKFENIRLSTITFSNYIYVSLFAGILFYVLSEVFRIGTKLKEENELTI